jgi:hypothetical protein
LLQVATHAAALAWFGREHRACEAPIIELEDSLTAFVKRTLGLNTKGRNIRLAGGNDPATVARSIATEIARAGGDSDRRDLLGLQYVVGVPRTGTPAEQLCSHGNITR